MSGFAIVRLLTLVPLVLVALGAWVWFKAGRDSFTSDLALAGAICFWAALAFGGISGLVWGLTAGDGVGCKNQATQMGLQYRYAFSTPCMVYDHGRWIDIDQVLNNQEAGS